MSINKLIEKLFHLHKREILAFAAHSVPESLAEDITQETFLRLMQHPDLMSIQNPRAYLFKTASNLSKNHYDYEQVRNQYRPQETVDFDKLLCPGATPEKSVETYQQIERFVSVLGQLPEVNQHAFILNKLDGLSYPQVAKCLGISEKSVQRYILKTWQHLVEHLGGDFL